MAANLVFLNYVQSAMLVILISTAVWSLESLVLPEQTSNSEKMADCQAVNSIQRKQI